MDRVSNAAMRLLRRLIPSIPVLTRSRVLFLPLDLIDAALARIFPELRGLPPARLRIRTGVRSKFVFNQVWFRYSHRAFWEDAFAAGWVDPDSAILDIGSGSGRAAIALREYGKDAGRYRGVYTGVDVDREMVEWCQGAYPKNFEFIALGARSRVYNPTGSTGPSVLPVQDGSQDFVFALSLFTHLLEEDLIGYLEEARRVLRPGGRLLATVFCRESLDLGGRWTFEHRRGAAHVESERYPEAAVAYERDWLLEQCRAAGFTESEMRAKKSQSVLTALR